MTAAAHELPSSRGLKPGEQESRGLKPGEQESRGLKPAAKAGPVPRQRHRWLVTFAVEGDLRFISHHDTLRLFQRALARADLPVRFTEGFNPHPRISIVVPRPVGVASQCEAIVIEFERPVEHDDLLNRLRRQAPRGLTIQDARILQNSERLAAQTVRYRLELTQPVPPDVAERVGQMNNVDKIEIERVHGETGRSQRIDIRPYVSDVRLEKGVVEFSLRVDGQGSAKPSEVAGLLGFDPHAVNHRICRLEIQWK